MKLRVVYADALASGLSPCGESGLKYHPALPDAAAAASLPVWGEWIEMLMLYAAPSASTVSPRVGRVD